MTSVARMVLGAPFLAALFGCASKEIWYKPGVTYQQMQRELAHCRFEAERSGPHYSLGSGLGALIASGAAKDRIIEECMLAKGFSEMEEQAAPAYARQAGLLPAQPESPLLSPKQPFVEEDFKPYEGSGTGVISGEAFLLTRSGEVKLGAGSEVVACPATSYSAEYFDRLIVRGERLSPPDPRVFKYYRKTIADGRGQFELKNLPPGKYYIGCEINWEVNGSDGPQRTGGIAYAVANVGGSERVSVIVTRPR